MFHNGRKLLMIPVCLIVYNTEHACEYLPGFIHKPIKFSAFESDVMEQEILKLQAKGMVVQVRPQYPQYILNVFIHPKKEWHLYERLGWSVGRARSIHRRTMECCLHINVLELFGIAVCQDKAHIHIRLMMDNQVAVTYTDHVGGRIRRLNKLTRTIWLWAVSWNI